MKITYVLYLQGALSLILIQAHGGQHIGVHYNSFLLFWLGGVYLSIGSRSQLLKMYNEARGLVNKAVMFKGNNDE